MLTIVLALLKKFKYARMTAEVVGVVLAILIGVAVHSHYVPKVVTTITVPGESKTITVEKPVLTTTTVTKVLKVTDPQDKVVIKALMDENAKLKVDVTELTQTVADLKQTGGGTVVVVPPTPTEPLHYTFKDWHLDFSTDTKTAKYTLTQNFEVVATTGRNASGTKVALVKLFEVGAKGERIPATNLKTTAVVVDETRPHWMVHLNVQGGIGYTRDVKGVQSPGGIVGIQWLKHGRTKATEDITFAVATPAFLFGPKVQDIGILPFSINLGQIPHQPFTNLWVSPFISKAKTLGGTVTATF